MGTNYYARIIPSEEDKTRLKQLIDINDFQSINYTISELYGSFNPYEMDDIPKGVIHLGKCSGGWKFLWNPNIYLIRNGHTEKVEIEPGHSVYKFIRDPDSAYYLYPLTKEGIKSFIDRENVEIFNEYNEKLDKDEFFNEALDWVTWNGKEAWDADSYDLAHPDEKVYSCKNEYTDFLESLGYKLSKYKNDFFSDGLRFSTSTEFC